MFRSKAYGRKLILRTLCAVERTAAPSLGNACGVERATDDVVTNAGEILYTTAADEDGRVLLQVVAFAGNVNGTFLLVCKANPCNFTDSRVRFFGRGRGDGNAYAALLGAVVENRRLALVNLLFSAVFDELIDCRHFSSSLFYSVFYDVWVIHCLGIGARQTRRARICRREHTMTYVTEAKRKPDAVSRDAYFQTTCGIYL